MKEADATQPQEPEESLKYKIAFNADKAFQL